MVFKNAPYSVIKGAKLLALIEAMKKFELFWKFFWLGFSFKQIIDSLSFLILLTHIGLKFSEKVLK